MTDDDEIRAIEETFRFLGLFDHRILETLKKMPKENRNTKKRNVQKFKKGEKRHWAYGTTINEVVTRTIGSKAKVLNS